MTNGRPSAQVWVLLALLAVVPAVPAAAQQKGKPANCYAYRLDENANKIFFNDPHITVMLPRKDELTRLRAQGTPGQVFLMKNCDAPDVAADFKVFAEPDGEDGQSEKVPSAVRVVVLAEEGEWVKVKGYTRLWKGTGWVKKTEKLLVIKF